MEQKFGKAAACQEFGWVQDPDVEPGHDEQRRAAPVSAEETALDQLE